MFHFAGFAYWCQKTVDFNVDPCGHEVSFLRTTTHNLLQEAEAEIVVGVDSSDMSEQSKKGAFLKPTPGPRRSYRRGSPGKPPS